MSEIAITAFSMPGPSAAAKASASTRRGKARKMSVMRISTASIQPPKYPAGRPMPRPTGTTMTLTMATMVSVMRAAEDDAGIDVAAQLVGAEGMRPGHRLQPVLAASG